jgi:hypothetical protein
MSPKNLLGSKPSLCCLSPGHLASCLGYSCAQPVWDQITKDQLPIRYLTPRSPRVWLKEFYEWYTLGRQDFDLPPWWPATLPKYEPTDSLMTGGVATALDVRVRTARHFYTEGLKSQRCGGARITYLSDLVAWIASRPARFGPASKPVTCGAKCGPIHHRRPLSISKPASIARGHISPKSGPRLLGTFPIGKLEGTAAPSPLHPSSAPTA